MGNAPKELTEIADFVAPSTSDGGMRIALEHTLQKAA
jgi:hydroxymethylpyrimidine pyrophosphatase-like HAD family hydrolase